MQQFLFGASAQVMHSPALARLLANAKAAHPGAVAAFEGMI